MKHIVVMLTAIILLAGVMSAQSAELPKIVCYSTAPNDYLNDHAEDVARIYDGFYFNLGGWEEGISANIGVGDAPPTTDWKAKAAKNIQSLTKAGVTENLITVCFNPTGSWPSPEALFSKEYLEKYARHYRALGRAAKELGFRGVCLDTEYTESRLEVTHESYKYETYNVEELLDGAEQSGRLAMQSILDEFPEAVIFHLPGELWGRPLDHRFVWGMLDVMAERDAPGGMHIATERTYSLLDPTAQVAISRFADCVAPTLLKPETLDYWKRRCTVAPGVWPIHMHETGGKTYPVRPWPEELKELEQQLQILSTVSKRYLWSFSGQPVWYQHTPEIEAKYGLAKQAIPDVDVMIKGWHQILSNRKTTDIPKVLKLVDHVNAFDRGEIDPAQLCHRFGTPGDWLVLGPLGNPNTNPAFFTEKPLFSPVQMDVPWHGRDGALRWFPFLPREARGGVQIAQAFDWRSTDKASALFTCWVTSKEEKQGFLNLGWDDGAIVRLGDKIVMDHRSYPERGHGAFYKDRYDFEDRAPVTIPKGRTRFSVTSINSHGIWGYNIRLSDEEGYPLEGLTFDIKADR